jgi:ABC-type uncharacterized transport system YnjBCD permease subunit
LISQEDSQETLARMSGMGLGMLLAHVTREHDFVVWISFLSLTKASALANKKEYRCVRCIWGIDTCSLFDAS